jgi:uncharacterized membrane protein
MQLLVVGLVPFRMRAVSAVRLVGNGTILLPMSLFVPMPQLLAMRILVANRAFDIFRLLFPFCLTDSISLAPMYSFPIQIHS